MPFPKNLLVFCLLLPVTLCAQNAADSVKDGPPKFEKVEVEASFPGGDAAWRTYITKNLKSDVPIKNGAPIGKYPVLVQFVVGKDGTVSSIKPLTNFGYGMEDEVIRIMERSGSWTAAMQNGKPVNAYRRQPVTFVVDQDDIQVTSKEPYTLFTGMENEITVSARKVNPAFITLMITKGSIIQTTDGRFIAKVNTPGRVIITVYNRKNDKELGTASFEVRNR